MSALVEVKDICKIYNPGENEVRALDHVSASFDSGKINALLGKNGSGKSPFARSSPARKARPAANFIWMDRS